MNSPFDSKGAALVVALSLLLPACTGDGDDTAETGASPDDAPGYIVVQIDAIEDPDTFFSEYANRAGPTLAKHGFVGMVASAEPDRFEGEAPDGWTVLLQFPSVDAAQAWYDDPEYVDARPFRIDSVGQTDMILVQGLSGVGGDLSAFGGYLLEQSEHVEDSTAFDSYLEDSAATMAGVGGVVLFEGEPVTVLEGEWPDDSTRVVGFPTPEAIADWYGSSEYGELRSERQAVTEGPSLAGFETFCVPMSEGCP